MAKSDRSEFARRNRVALSAFFLACLAFAALRGNVPAGLAGIGGIVWVAWAHLRKR